MEDHNPFETGEVLVACDTGLADVDRVEEIGALVQNQITGKGFSECSFKKKGQIVNLQSLYSSIKIGEEKVIIDPLNLSFFDCNGREKT